MDRGKIWLVVPPKVGVPLYLGSVAVIALLVHYAVLTHTTWFSAFLQGGAKGKVAEVIPAQPTPMPTLAAR